MRRTDAARALEEFVLPPLLREAFHILCVHGVVQRDTEQRTPIADDLLLSLASLWPEDTAVAATTDDGPVEPPRFVVTPAVTRGITRRAAGPPPALPRATQTTGPPLQRATTTAPRPTRRLAAGKLPARLSLPVGAMPQEDEASVPSPAPASPPPAEKADSDSIANPSRDDEILETFELRRGLSAQLARMEDVLRDKTQLLDAQCQDVTLQSLSAKLESGRAPIQDYLLVDDELLWYAPR